MNATRGGIMLENVGNLRTSEIELRYQLSALECDWLTGCLHAENGVADVKWAEKMRRLFVEHDADIFGSADLVDFLRTCGVPVAAVRAGYVGPGIPQRSDTTQLPSFLR